MPAQNEIPRFSELSVPYTQGFYMSAECPAQPHHCTCLDKTDRP